MDPKKLPPDAWRYVPELAVEIVPTEAEEAARNPTKKEDEFWVWNTNPSKTPGRKDQPS